MNKYYVGSTCLRYAVPFRYQETYEQACTNIEAMKEREQLLWMRRKCRSKEPESDIFDYIRNEIRYQEDDASPYGNRIGTEWMHYASAEADVGTSKPVRTFFYSPDGTPVHVSSNLWKLEVSNLGLDLFRNGVGVIWYEFKISNHSKQIRMDSEWLKEFQNKIRELNRYDKLLWEITYEETPDLYSESHGYKKYAKPVLLGLWLDDILQNIQISHTYFAHRICKGNSNRTVADKAMLFSYVTFSETDNDQQDAMAEREAIAYRLTNGYRDSYCFSKETAKEMRHPFDNVIWYATQEGAGYFAWPDASNQTTFDSDIRSKICTDYFTLYLKVLHQSFSLLLYAEKIQMDLTENEEDMNVLPELCNEISFFLTKSMATTVSHIHNQSEFYIYLKERMRVHADVKSVTAGLNALENLQRERHRREAEERSRQEWEEEKQRDQEEKQRDERLQIVLGFVSLLAVASALVDAFDFIAKFANGADGGWTSILGHPVVMVVEVIFCMLIVFVGIFAFRWTWKTYKEYHTSDRQL